MQKFIPTQSENPNGLHQRYHVMKVDKDDILNLTPTDAGSEYFNFYVKYNKATHSIEELPEMKEPEHYKESYTGIERTVYLREKTKYKEHIASLKTYPVAGEVNWKDVDILEEGKDFKIQYQRYAFAPPVYSDDWSNCSLEEYEKLPQSRRRIVAIPIEQKDSENISVEKSIDLHKEAIRRMGDPKVMKQLKKILAKSQNKYGEKEKEDEVGFVEWIFKNEYTQYQLGKFRKKKELFRYTTKELYILYVTQTNLVECKDKSKTDPEIKKAIDEWVDDMAERKKEFEYKEKEDQDELWKKVYDLMWDVEHNNYPVQYTLDKLKKQFSISKK